LRYKGSKPENSVGFLMEGAIKKSENRLFHEKSISTVFKQSSSNFHILIVIKL